jgi:DNA-binding beta-propeller fold protein YncE
VNKVKLGDVAQSITRIDNALWIVVNNSGKVYLCDTNLVIKYQIKNLVSPRYACKVSKHKVYVTELYADKIWIINTLNYSLQNYIPLKGWTEELLLINDTIVAVTNCKSEFLYFINTKTDKICDSIKLTLGSCSIEKDKFGFLWVGCLGNKQSGFVIYQIDFYSKKILKQWRTTNSLSFSPRLCFNPTKDTLYWIENGIKRNEIMKSTYPNEVFFPTEKTSNFYGLDIDSSRNEIYVLDAKNFSQNGEMIRLKSNGEVLSRKKTGIIPNGVFCN